MGTLSRSNFNLEMPVFEERKKPLGARTRTNNKLNPHMTPSPGIEPGPHWWEASALTTAPSLLHKIIKFSFISYLKTKDR